MGLFGKLFEKKVCDICGGEIGLLGNRKLEDGNCCKECAKKLSPWFNERKHSTVTEIKEQLDYRESNKAAVAAFRVTRSFGEDMKVLVDENAGKFMVTRAENLKEANPDVLDFSQVTACELDIKEDKDEDYREVKDSDGQTKRERYSPPRYKFSYDFEMTLRVDHPYFDEMRFSLSDGYIEVKTSGAVRGSVFGISFTADTGTLNESSPTPPTLEDKRGNVKYAECEKQAEEIRQVLMQRSGGGGNSGFASLIDAFVRTGEYAKNGNFSDNPAEMQAAFAAWGAAKDALMAACQRDPQGAMSSGALEAIQRFNDSGSGAPAQFSRAADSGAPAQFSQPAKQTVTCPWCGAVTSAGKFCEHCGAALK